MMPTLTQRLRQARRVLQKRRWAALVLHAGLVTLVLLLGFAAFNQWASPVREAHAFRLILLVGLAWIAFSGWISYRIWSRPPSLPQLAGRVEETHSEWMDGLICATEQEQKPESQRRPLEKALVEQMQRKTAPVDFEAVLVPAHCRNNPLLAALGAGLLLAALLAASSFSQKGFHHLADLLRGHPSGLAILPGDGEAPVRTDVEITAQVMRWENRPAIEYIDHSGRHLFPMNVGEKENHSFTFYDILGDVRYRVLTPSLTSPWHQISSYVPPVIERTRLRITPPSYTGLPAQEFDQLRGLTAIEGSRIEWELESSTARRATLLRDSEEIPMKAADEGTFALTLTLDQSFSGRFIIRDQADRSARTPEFALQAQPDLPPTIEVTQPGRDTEAEPLAQVGLQAIAADDFGLTEIALHLSISGRRQTPVRLFVGPDPVAERTVRTTLDLAALEAVEGDVVVYFFTATDNREPNAQQTRSEIYFIEVREEVVPEEAEGEPMELENIDLQAIILELKRLIRLSWEASTTRNERTTRDIASGLEEVRLETAAVQQAIIEQAGEEAAAPVVALMNRAMQRMETASQLVDQSLIDDSIPYQEMALADIVAIQTEFMKNQTTSEEPSEGSSGDSSSPQRDGEEEDFAQEMQKLMNEIQRLSDQQAAQNSAMRRLAASDLSSDQQEEFTRRQEDMREQSDQINQALSGLRGAETARRDLVSASSSMESASAQIEGNRAEAAARDGDRARSSLLSALENLEDFMAQATGNQVAELARQAEQLAQQQGAAAGGSRGLAQSDSPSPAEAAALREQQEAMQQQLQDLLAAMDDTANQLRDSQPEAARAVAEASQQVRDQNVAAEMGRAGNALLYRRFDRAADIQEAAADNLGQLADSLEASANLMPSMSRQQLQQLLQQLQQAQQEVMGMTGQSADEMGERMEQITSRLGERLGRAGQALRDPTLQELSGQLSAASQEGQSPNIFRVTDLLRAASRSLERQIFALEVERRARLQRQVSEPPEKYRGLVEEYFKDLSETP